MEHEAEIVVALTPYLLAFPQSKLAAEGLAVYAKALSGLSVDEINAAMLKILWTSKFWPSVAEIFEAAESIRNHAEGRRVPTAAEAWGEVRRQARKNGMHRKWEYSCPEVQKALELFGKEELCMGEESQINTSRAQFMRMYNEVVRREKDERENEAVLAILPEAKKKVIALAEAKKWEG